MNKIFIAIPTKNGWLQSHLVSNILPYISDNNNTFYIEYGTSPVSQARMNIYHRFMESECTHLWMIDDDTIPPLGALEMMLAHNKPVVSGVTNVLSKGGVRDNVYTNEEGVVLGVGASCLLLEGSVIEAVLDGVDRVAEEWTDAGFISEDIALCNRLKELKYEIFIDRDVACLHVKEILI